MPKAYTALSFEFQMSRLLNCCGRRKKTLLDLKESMLGPFMLLALRGDSSFIQVSAIIYRANSQQARAETGLGIPSFRFPLSFFLLSLRPLIQVRSF